jgi:hypothetical protein
MQGCAMEDLPTACLNCCSLYNSLPQLLLTLQQPASTAAHFARCYFVAACIQCILCILENTKMEVLLDHGRKKRGTFGHHVLVEKNTKQGGFPR